jgi:hypothetical protein
MQSSRKIAIPKVESHFSHSIPVKMGNDFTQFLSTCLWLLALFPFCKANCPRLLDIKCHKMYLASLPSWHNFFILCHDLAFGLADLIIFLWVTPFTWDGVRVYPPSPKRPCQPHETAEFTLCSRTRGEAQREEPNETCHEDLTEGRNWGCKL